MMKNLHIHPQNPQPRLLKQVVDELWQDKLIICPTELGYQFGLTLHAKNALQQLERITEPKLTLLCRNLSELSNYANIDNAQHRLLKQHTPSPTIFMLHANKNVPKKFIDPKHKTIAISISHHPMILALLELLDAPLLVSPLYNQQTPEQIEDDLGKQVDVFINIGKLAIHTATMVDISGEMPTIVQQGEQALPL